MRGHLSRSVLPLALILLVLAIVPPEVPLGHALSSSSYLSVVSSGTVFAASRNNTMAIEIKNVGKYLKELDVALTIPPPLVLFGDNHWIRPYFAFGDMIHANLTIFAPSSAAGTTLQGSVVATYKLVGETTVSSETHSLSFLVRGWIDMTVYEVTVSPDPALPGSEITVSGNLLNRGVIPAMYTNVTMAEDQPFAKGSVTPTYVGEVDPNAPAPFSVTAVVDSAATERSYQATILVYYRDDLQFDHVLPVQISFTVVTELPETRTTSTGIVAGIVGELLSNQLLLMLGLAVLVILLIVGAVIRRRRRSRET